MSASLRSSTRSSPTTWSLATSATIRPETNAHQTLVAARVGRRWQVVLSQNTPAAFHGRPDLVEAMTQELQRELEQRASPSREL